MRVRGRGSRSRAGALFRQVVDEGQELCHQMVQAGWDLLAYLDQAERVEQHGIGDDRHVMGLGPADDGLGDLSPPLRHDHGRAVRLRVVKEGNRLFETGAVQCPAATGNA